MHKRGGQLLPSSALLPPSARRVIRVGKAPPWAFEAASLCSAARLGGGGGGRHWQLQCEAAGGKTGHAATPAPLRHVSVRRKGGEEFAPPPPPPSPLPPLERARTSASTTNSCSGLARGMAAWPAGVQKRAAAREVAPALGWGGATSTCARMEARKRERDMPLSTYFRTARHAVTSGDASS